MLKVSKNVTFEMDNLMAIEELMTRTRRNFSQTLNILIKNWITMQRQLKKVQDDEEKIKQQYEKELREQEFRIRNAKAITNEK